MWPARNKRETPRGTSPKRSIAVRVRLLGNTGANTLTIARVDQVAHARTVAVVDRLQGVEHEIGRKG